MIALFLACTNQRAADGVAGLDTTRIKAAIQQQWIAMDAAARAGDIDAALAIYTADAATREPGIAVQSADSIRAIFAAALSASEVLGITYTPERFVFTPDRAVEFGVYRERQRDRASGAEIICDCRYAAEWVQESGGRWRIRYLFTGPRVAPGALPWEKQER